MVKRKAQPPSGLSEHTRTILLFALLFVGIAFILWAQSQYEQNFVESF